MFSRLVGVREVEFYHLVLCADFGLSAQTLVTASVNASIAALVWCMFLECGECLESCPVFMEQLRIRSRVGTSEAELAVREIREQFAKSTSRILVPEIPWV